MPLGSESSSAQRPFIRYAVEAGWTYLSPDQALNLRQGGVASPALEAVLLGQLAKLNPGIVNAERTRDIVRLRPTIERNLDAWEFLKGLKTVFVDTVQWEIAAQLSVADAKLAAEECRRSALVALFQSLLHHLMTGRVRLPEFAGGRNHQSQRPVKTHHAGENISTHDRSTAQPKFLDLKGDYQC